MNPKLVAFIFLLSLVTVGAQKAGASDEKIVVDGDANAEKQKAWANMELIPHNQLCLLCQSIITKFQQENTKNPDQFKNVSPPSHI